MDGGGAVKEPGRLVEELRWRAGERALRTRAGGRDRP
jgi:hypothetical protein